ncbi:MAG: nucleoside-diphosphate sugar epimerase/dehydratase [Erysipelotrichaceae bacterium]|nr:nucleoside-diphosphate sugar epimerase/dehydratase [Erysipelotrichaceae bacterium]MDO5121989.1 nucleoside-diphosphate sugar epimerase/dehydratase [Erysipelotrichaceae bacterium]
MMKQINAVIRKNRELSLFLVDTFSIILAYVLGFLLRFLDASENITFYAAYFEKLVVTLPIVLLINYLFFYLLKVNRSLWKYTGIDEVARIGLATLGANLIWFLIVYFKPVRPYIRSIPVIAMLLQLVIMLGIRFGYRAYRTNWMRKQKHHNAVIIGAGSAGALLYRDILTNDRIDANVIGYIDDNPVLTGKRINGVTVLGTVKDIAEINKQHQIDIVYVAIPSAPKKRIAEIIDSCSAQGLRTQIMDYRVKENLEEISSLREVSVEDLLGREEVHLDTDSISDYLTGRNVMVTGGGGSIGSELCRQILRYEPRRLVIYDIYENNMYQLQQEILMQNRKTHQYDNTEIICRIGSVRDSVRLDEILNEYPADVVFHAAAHKHVPLVEDSPKEAVKNNVFGTLKTLQACIRHNVGRFILISTDKAVNPTNAMGATKRMTELIIQALRNNGVTKLGAVRFGNVLGSNGSVIPLFREEILNGGPVTVTDPEIERYFMTIPEAASLVLQAGAYADQGDIFVLDMGTRVKILKLAENMITLSGYKPYEDIEIEFIGLRPGEKMYEEISLGNENRYTTANNRVFVNERMDIDRDHFFHELKALYEKLDSASDEEIHNELFRLIEEYK